MNTSEIETKLKLPVTEPRSSAERMFSKLIYNTPFSINNKSDNNKCIRVYRFLRTELIPSIEDNKFKKKVREFVTALGSRISSFEKDYYPTDEILPREILKSFMSDHNLAPKDLKNDIGSLTYVHKVLSGEREISVKVAKKLGSRFAVKPNLFLDL
jgi:antitoxin component HigA of HigAB toxin-antitoxin module